MYDDVSERSRVCVLQQTTAETDCGAGSIETARSLIESRSTEVLARNAFHWRISWPNLFCQQECQSSPVLLHPFFLSDSVPARAMSLSAAESHCTLPRYTARAGTHEHSIAFGELQQAAHGDQRRADLPHFSGFTTTNCGGCSASSVVQSCSSCCGSCSLLEGALSWLHPLSAATHHLAAIQSLDDWDSTFLLPLPAYETKCHLRRAQSRSRPSSKFCQWRKVWRSVCDAFSVEVARAVLEQRRRSQDMVYDIDTSRRR